VPGLRQARGGSRARQRPVAAVPRGDGAPVSRRHRETCRDSGWHQHKEKISRRARDNWGCIYSAGGAHVNFMMDEGDDRVRATYGKNYDRLAKIKKRQ
jgi:hypothetical protein